MLKLGKIIAEKLKILEEELTKKSSRNAIILAQQQLTKAAENLILDKVNVVLNEKISGRKVDDV